MSDRHTLRMVILGDLLIILVLAVLSYGLIAHFDENNANLRDVNRRQDAAAVAACVRGNSLRALLLELTGEVAARGAVRPPAVPLTVLAAQKIAPIVNCKTGVPLPASAQRAFINHLISHPK